jgi:hypothetical protein
MSPSSAIQQAASAYFYVAIWMSVSIGVILFNKWLLAFAGFPFPITLTLWHMFFCSAAGFLCVRVLKITKSFNLSVEEYVTRVMPIGTLLHQPPASKTSSGECDRDVTPLLQGSFMLLACG